MQLEAGQVIQRLKPLFDENFERFGELGAAVSVWQNGKPIIDLCGGFCDQNIALLMEHVRHRARVRHCPPRPGAPVIRLRAWNLLGGPTIYRVPPQARGLGLKEARRLAKAAGRGADLLMTARQLSRSRYCFTKSQRTSAM
jgi:hypothetical protein